MDFDGAIGAGDIMALSTIDPAGVATNRLGNITAVDAGARTITLGFINIGLTDTATVTYYYVADSFEVDNLAPTVEFTPDGSADVENASPFIRVKWTDDAYEGDSFNTVTLTAASLTDPAGVTTDVLANFVTTDNKEYIWAASNLALGSYTLTVSGKDTALNEAKDKAVTFKLIARAPYAVALEPGWNLVSLPGPASDSAIAAVITNMDVDVVLGYDPTTVAKWMTATRDASGNWVGNLTSIDSNKGYWVHTTTFEPINVDIPALAAGAAVLPPAFAVSQGWNLVGVSVLDLTAANPLADTYFNSVAWIRAYTFNTGTNQFDGILPEEVPARVVTVGKGYFVYITKAGTLVP